MRNRDGVRAAVGWFRVCVVLAWFLMPSPAAGQDTLWYRSLGVEEGLSQNFVTAMVADHDGFMWFGTVSGLDRWDGYGFESFRHDPEDPSSLSASTILAMHVDAAGTLWVGTSRGLDRFDRAANAFRRYRHSFRRSGARDAIPAEAIVSDRAGRIWFASHARPRLSQLDPRTGQVREYIIPGTEGQQLTALYVDGADRLWVATQPGAQGLAQQAAHRVFVFDRCSEIAGAGLPPGRTPLPLDVAGGKIVAILEDRAHRLWFARSTGGLTRYDARTGAVDRVAAGTSNPGSLAGDEVRSVALGPSGEIWALAFPRIAETADVPRGLHRVDPETLEVRRVDLRERLVGPGSDAQLERLSVDPSGVLWLGSNAGGLRYADVSSRGLSLYRKEVVGAAGLSTSFVRAVLRARDGIVWVGTPRGLDRIDRARGSVQHFGGRSASAALYLSNPNVQALHEDREGHIWIGTPDGLTVREPSGAVRRYRHRATDANSLSGDYVQVIHEGRDGRLWVGTLGSGLNALDLRTRSFTRYPGHPDAVAGLPSSDVTALLSDAQHVLWVGTTAGLARLDTSPGGAGRIEPVSTGAGGLGGVSVLSIAASAATPGMLWIGTEQRGLGRLDLRDDAVRFFTTRNSGLPDDTVYGILPDAHGRLWMSTNRGLVRFEPASETFRAYVADQTLQSLEFNARAFHGAPDGELFFGGVGGLNAFYPDRLGDNPFAPRILVSAVRTSNRDAVRSESASTVIYRHGMARQVAEIAYGQRDVTVDYVALHYSDAARNRYYYRLDNYDTGWIGPVVTRQARYTNLGPGAYTFRVKAVSSQGIPSDGEETFAFRVLPPFYATAWFRGIVGLAVPIAIAVGYRLRVRRLHRRQDELERQVSRRTEELRQAAETLERQAQQLKELDAAKSRIFANVSHEFRTPLTLTLGPLRDVRSGRHGEIPGEALEEIDLAIRNTERQLSLVDQLLVLARLDAGQLEFRPRPARLDECVRLAAAPYESLARRRRMRFSVELPDTDVSGMFDAERLQQALGNLLDNAFKFTPTGGAIALRLSDTRSGWAVIQVDDTGPGIPAKDLPHVFERFYRGTQETGEFPGTGIGLALARECVELHSGEIAVENRPGAGTRFTVHLPMTSASSAPAAARSGRVAVVSATTVAEPNETTAASAGQADADSVTPGRATVLVVDDHPDMRAYLGKHLAPHYRVLEAARGDEGLERVRAEIPDAIISDVMMPGMDGYAFCRALKSDPETDFLPVILLTAKAGSEGLLEGLEGGADDYLTKPFEPAELLARIRNLLHSRERLRARFAPPPGGTVQLATPRLVRSVDEALLGKVRQVLDDGAHEETFDVAVLAGGLGMSRAQLHRRVKEAFDSTPAELIIR